MGTGKVRNRKARILRRNKRMVLSRILRYMNAFNRKSELLTNLKNGLHGDEEVCR